jgi:hypothetical protein
MLTSRDTVTDVSICRTVGAIQKKIAKQGERNPVSHPPHAKDDKETIAAWGRDLDRILYTFTVRPYGFV